MSTSITRQDMTEMLYDNRHEVIKKNGLREFLQEKKTTTPDDLANLFKGKAWEKCPSDGHRNVKNKITNVKIGYPTHGRSNGLTDDEYTSVRENVQTHVNILGNNIFKVKGKGWDDAPNYKEVVERVMPSDAKAQVKGSQGKKNHKKK